MPKYLSGRVKLSSQSALGTDRYQYLNLSQVEPNLGTPVPPGDTVPFGQQYQIVSLADQPGKRYWVPVGGGLIPGSITVFDEGELVGGISSTIQLNFVGAAISAFGISNPSPGLGVTVRIFAPGNDKEILFNTSNEFSTSSILKFDSSAGILTAGNAIHVGLGGTYFITTGVGSVGIRTANPTQELDLNGDLRLRGTVYDFNNQPGNTGDLLVKNNLGGLIWISQSSIRAGAGGTYQNIQFHNSSSLVDGAPNFVYDEINGRVGIGSTRPRVLLDVLGITSFSGGVLIDNLRVSGVTTTSTLAVSGTSTTRNLLVTGITTLGQLVGTSANFSGIVTAAKFIGDIDVVNLSVTGIATIARLGVTGVTTTVDLAVTRNFSVSGVSTLNGQVNINNLNVTGVSTFDNIKLDTNTVSTLSGNLILDSLAGTTQINDAVYINDATESTSKDTGSLVTEGGVGIEKNLYVGGETRLATSGGITTTGGDLYVGGDLYIRDDIFYDEISGRRAEFSEYLQTRDFRATGVSTLGVTSISQLFVSGISTFNGVIDSNGGAYIDNIQIGITNDNQIDTATGNLIIGSSGGLTTIDNRLRVTGISTFNGNSTFDSNVLVSGISTFNGNVNLGDSITDTVTFTSRVNSNILPSSNATYNLGSVSITWNDVYATRFNGRFVGNADTATQVSTGNTVGVSSYYLTFVDSNNVSRDNEFLYTDSEISFNPSTDLLSVGKVYVSGISTFNGNSKFNESATVDGAAIFNGNVTLGDASSDKVFVNASIGSTVRIDVTDTYDLGTSNSLRWKNVYAQTFNGQFVGNADSATRLANARNFSINGTNSTINAGDVSASAVSFDGTGNVILNGSLKAVTGLSAGTYGNSILVPVISVNNQGIVTSITSTGINFSTATVQNSDNVKTVTTSTNATFYPTFVNSDNAIADYEAVYTDAGISYNPSTNTLTANKLNVSETTASTITAVLTRGADNNFQLTAQNGTGTNASGQEVSRIGINYSGTGWNSYLKFVRGSGAQDGSITIATNNTDRVQFASNGSVLPLSTLDLGGVSNRWGTVYANTFDGLTKVNSQNLETVNLLVTGIATVNGFFRPSVGSGADKGIYWQTDPGGGSGDEAFIRYYVESGENTRLHIGIRNDADDDIYLESNTVNVANNLAVAGTLNANGNTVLGDLNTDTVTFTARINSNTLPSTDATLDLGGSSNRWNNVYARTFNGQFVGNADTASRLATARNIAITGDLAWNVNFDGSANVTAVGTLANSGVVANTYGSSTVVPVFSVDAKGRVTSVTNTGINFSTATVAQADKLTNARNIAITGDLSWNVNFDGSGNVTSTGTLANSGVTAGTYGSSTQVGIVTVDAKGRITAASNVPINFSTATVAQANNIRTISIATNADFFPTFVATNSGTAVYQSVYTDSGIRYNPNTDLLTLSSLTASGTGTFNGNVNLGASTANTVTFNSLVNSSIVPSANNTYDLGSNSLRWNNLYVNSIVGTVTGKADATTQLSPRSSSPYTTIDTQGTYIHWNRNNGDGATWLINQRGVGSGGFYFGESTASASNTLPGTTGFTQTLRIDGSGNVTSTGLIDATTPNSGSTGGVRIRANATSGNAYLQFTNNAATSEFLNLKVTSGTGAITGQLHISRDNAGECCSNGNYTLSLAENTSGTGKSARIQFHNAGVHEGYIALAASGTRRMIFGDNQSVGMGIECSGNVTANGVNLGSVSTGFYGDANNLAVRMPTGTFYIQNNGGTATYATIDSGGVRSYANSGYFSGNGSTMYLDGGQYVNFITNGVTRAYWGPAGGFAPAANNAYNCGGAAGPLAWSVVVAYGFQNLSDKTLKTDVKECSFGIDFIKSLKPVEYKFKVGRNEVSKDEEGNDVITPIEGKRTHFGFIAQDVKEVLDDNNVDSGMWSLGDKDDPESIQSLNYMQFVAPLTKALQEAIAKIEKLEQQVSDLQSKINN